MNDSLRKIVNYFAQPATVVKVQALNTAGSKTARYTCADKKEIQLLLLKTWTSCSNMSTPRLQNNTANFVSRSTCSKLDILTLNFLFFFKQTISLLKVKLYGHWQLLHHLKHLINTITLISHTHSLTLRKNQNMYNYYYLPLESKMTASLLKFYLTIFLYYQYGFT